MGVILSWHFEKFFWILCFSFSKRIIDAGRLFCFSSRPISHVEIQADLLFLELFQNIVELLLLVGCIPLFRE